MSCSRSTRCRKRAQWFLDRVSLLRAALNSGHPETIDWKVSEEIFGALFPDEESAIMGESQKIVFIPDDVLFALPFELYSPNASRGDFVFLGKASDVLSVSGVISACQNSGPPVFLARIVPGSSRSDHVPRGR